MSAIYWIRRDLRLHDNPALQQAMANGVTKALFITTPEQWQLHDMAPIKADLFRHHLLVFAAQLRGLGMEFILLHSTNFTQQKSQLIEYCQMHHIDEIYANSEPELNEVNRDRAIAEVVSLKLFHCDTILPLGSVLNQQGEMFKVFTPFRQAWLKRIRELGVECVVTPSKYQSAVEPITVNEIKLTDLLPLSLTTSKSSLIDAKAWPLSSQVMEQVLPQFWQDKLFNYQNDRDFPALKGTSGLSPYLAIGAISPRWLVLQLIQRHPEVIYDQHHGAFAWLNELIWRDFYRHLLFHYPNLITGDSFQIKYQNMQWPGNVAYYQAWCEGRTGYPIVDAAMKQLISTGWMHNRLRMIVASFLTKDLLIDWRWGERFFMQHLIDGDFSANNGGWQWAASTGCDAQPYFRIFNPVTQSQKFDPRGAFIRQYLPELADVPDKHIHFPHKYLIEKGRQDSYCQPLVDHKHARMQALALYKSY